ncbi:CKMT2 [Symbiodinium natans]|uniref:CKMT2 protein n=1 Tax=Symbiodinium natans TaxID=878477 RepID=A0A812KDB3_9DINO|nr:CKMT2 [Symbiodinium natans]
MAERRVAVMRLKEDLARLRNDTVAAREEELRLKTQAASETLLGGKRREALMGQQQELRAKLEEFARSTDVHKASAREWQEELESLERHQALAVEQVQTLEKANGRLREVAAEHALHLARAEARVKRFEARRSQTKAEVVKLQQQLSKQAETTNVCTTVDGPSKTEATERAASIIAHQHHSRVANSKKERAGSSKAARAKQMCNGTQRSNKPNRKESEEAEEVWGLEQKWQVTLLFLLVLVIALGPYLIAQLLDRS